MFTVKMLLKNKCLCVFSPSPCYSVKCVVSAAAVVVVANLLETGSVCSMSQCLCLPLHYVNTSAALLLRVIM